LLLRLESRHAAALELFSGPTLGGGTLVDNVTGHDERVLEQAGVRLHAGAREQTRARAQDRAITDVKRVEVELATSVDVADERGIIDTDTVAEVKEIRLSEVERRCSGGEDGAVESNVGTEATEVHGDPSSAGEQTKDTVTSVAGAAERLELEEQLPALAVRGFVPVVVALCPATHENPLDSDDGGEGDNRLRGHDCHNECAEHGVEDDGTFRGCGQNVSGIVVATDKVTKDLNSTNGSNVPVDSDGDGDEGCVTEDEELAPDAVGSLSLVEGTTERRSGLLLEGCRGGRGSRVIIRNVANHGRHAVGVGALGVLEICVGEELELVALLDGI
jgi:hypothetical protein